jgi:polar amino acid transport system substrate-binding protein
LKTPRPRTSSPLSLLSALTAVLFCPPGPAYCQPADRPLVWASDAEGGAPYIFKDPQNPQNTLGFEVDLIAALARELGRRIEFKQYEFSNLTTGLDRGDFNFAMNGLEITPDRKQRWRFSRPYYIYRQQLVARAGEDRFRSLEECKAKGGVVGTMEDTAAQRLLVAQQLEPKLYPDPNGAYTDLSLGRLDAVLLDLPMALYYAQPRPDLKFVGQPFGKGYYAIAFRKDDAALADQFDAALERLLEKGDLRRIYEKWRLWNDDQDELRRASAEDVRADSSQTMAFSAFFPELLDGAKMTIVISVLSMLVAIGLGLPIALARLYGAAPLRWLAIGYVEFFRGIPVLLLLTFIYLGLPGMAQYYGWPVTLRLPPLAAAVLGFGLNYAAYEAEIYRAGICTIPGGQWEAAASLGMSKSLTFRRIILPQALRTILPPMTSDFVALFKDTSVVSVVAVVELTKQYQMLARSTMQYLEMGLATAALYLIMSVPLGYLSRYLEHRWSKGAAH